MRVLGGIGRIAAFGLLVGLAFATGAQAQESEIPVDQVPKAVMDSARAKFPGAKVREAARETEDGKTVYELEMTHDGKTMDVTFQEDGTLALVESEVAEGDVPAVVVQAVKGKYPGAKINLVESVKKGPAVKKEVDYYEFHVTTRDKKSAEAEVDSKGKILKTEEKKATDKD
jgi:uncharacterized membrane protein YkoI